MFELRKRTHRIPTKSPNGSIHESGANGRLDGEKGARPEGRRRDAIRGVVGRPPPPHRAASSTALVTKFRVSSPEQVHRRRDHHARAWHSARSPAGKPRGFTGAVRCQLRQRPYRSRIFLRRARGSAERPANSGSKASSRARVILARARSGRLVSLGESASRVRWGQGRF